MTLYWLLWITIPLVMFIAGESYALLRGKATLSRSVWTLSRAWPPFPFFVGFVVGFLACHFWWGGIVAFAPVG